MDRGRLTLDERLRLDLASTERDIIALKRRTARGAGTDADRRMLDIFRQHAKRLRSKLNGENR